MFAFLLYRLLTKLCASNLIPLTQIPVPCKDKILLDSKPPSSLNASSSRLDVFVHIFGKFSLKWLEVIEDARSAKQPLTKSLITDHLFTFLGVLLQKWVCGHGRAEDFIWHTDSGRFPLFEKDVQSAISIYQVRNLFALHNLSESGLRCLYTYGNECMFDSIVLGERFCVDESIIKLLFDDFKKTGNFKAIPRKPHGFVSILYIVKSPYIYLEWEWTVKISPQSSKKRNSLFC